MMCNLKRARMCEAEATLWAEAYLYRLLADPEHFDTDYSILLSYPDEVIACIYKINPTVYHYLSTTSTLLQ